MSLVILFKGAVTPSFSAPTLNVWFAFGTPPANFVTGWYELADRVVAIDIQRGRQTELDRIEAGTCTITFDDQSRDLDPGNAASIFYPNIQPLTPVKILVTFLGVQYPIFTGFVERWDESWAASALDNTMSVTCVDGFEPLAQSGLATTIASGLSGDQIDAVLDQVNWLAGSRQIDNGQSVLVGQTYDATSPTDALSVLQAITESESGLFFINADGDAVFQDRLRRQTTTASASTFGDGDPAVELEYTSLSPSFDKDRIVNDWIVTGASGTPQEASDSASITSFFQRTGQRTTLLSDVDALATAQALLSDTKVPQLRLDSMTFEPVNDNNLWLEALTRDISSRITVIRRPKGGGTPIAQDCFIESIQWQLRPPYDAQITWRLSTASNVSLLTLNDATLGKLDTGVLAF